MSSSFGHVHVHSNFSTVDGMVKPEKLIERAAQYKQPFMALTDHKNMSGTVQAYQAAKKFGIKFFPGQELYIIDPKFDLSMLDSEEIKKAQRFHLGIFALNLHGYQGLVKLSTLAFERPRFHAFPRLLVDDLIEMGQEFGDDIAVTTGCVFGLFEKTLIDEGVEAARGILRMLKQVTPNVLVEIQKHSIPDTHSEMPEDELIEKVLQLADEEGLRIIATSDSHYLDQSQKAAHNMMKKMVYAGKDDEFPGDTFHFASTGWMKEKWSDEIWAKVEETCDWIATHEVVIPELDNYVPHIPKMAKDSDKTLRDLCTASLTDYLADSSDDVSEYWERLETELETIAFVGVSDYALLVRDGVEFFHQENILTESRGSVNGSLVFFLLGATQVDPIQWGTVFGRFIDKSRVGQSPDVDQDIADSERWKVLEYYDKLELNGKKYKTSRIGTYSNLGQKKDDPDDTGSAFTSYIGYLRKKSQADAWDEEVALAEKEDRKPIKARATEKGAIKFNAGVGKDVKSLDDVKKYYPADYKGLKEIVDMKSVYSGYGTHAGGILISGEEVDIPKFIPQMFVPSGGGTWVTQYTMKDVEQFGLLKMDILGQTSLSVMQKCLEFMGREDTHDFTWIPYDDGPTMNMLKNINNYCGIFHAEGYAKGVVMKEMKPVSTEELVLWQALAMPGVVDSGAKDILLTRRKNKTKRFGYKHPLLKEVFDKTYGVMVYQEQVIQYCQKIGMTDKEVTGFFKIVKDSGEGAVERNRKRLEEAKPRFYDLSRSVELDDKDIDWVWDQCIAMGGYAFSINHSAGYGIRTYRMAYLKKHFPSAYMGALLYCWSGTGREVKYKGGKKLKMDQRYLIETERLGIPVLPVDINKSQANWTVEKKKFLRKGFKSVKGIGDAAATKLEDNAPYTDLDDLCTRSKVTGFKKYLDTGEKTSVIAALDRVGALNF